MMDVTQQDICRMLLSSMSNIPATPNSNRHITHHIPHILLKIRTRGSHDRRQGRTVCNASTLQSNVGFCGKSARIPQEVETSLGGRAARQRQMQHFEKSADDPHQKKQCQAAGPHWHQSAAILTERMQASAENPHQLEIIPGGRAARCETCCTSQPFCGQSARVSNDRRQGRTVCKANTLQISQPNGDFYGTSIQTLHTPGRPGRIQEKCSTSRTFCGKSAQDAMTGGRAAPSAVLALYDSLNRASLRRIRRTPILGGRAAPMRNEAPRNQCADHPHKGKQRQAAGPHRLQCKNFATTSSECEFCGKSAEL